LGTGFYESMTQPTVSKHWRALSEKWICYKCYCHDSNTQS